MIELPSAALNSSSIAKHADFFSFGTNDLTQTTLGLSRDDASKFLNTYIESDIFSIDPFVSIDQASVGRVVKMSVDEGKKSNNELKIGVCGEHAGEAKSIKFFNTLEIDYSFYLLKTEVARSSIVGDFDIIDFLEMDEEDTDGLDSMSGISVSSISFVCVVLSFRVEAPMFI